VAGRLCDLFGRQPLEVSELNHLTLTRFEEGEYLLHQARDLLRRQAYQMPRSIEEFCRCQLIQFLAIVKVMRLKMLPAVNGPMISVLKQPGFKASASGIELIYCSKYIQKDTLNCFLGFAIIAQNRTRYAEDESTVSFKQNGQGIVAAPAQSIHEVGVTERPK
jgi:hypothetical protein